MKHIFVSEHVIIGLGNGFFQVMTCCIYIAKPLGEPIVVYMY